MIRILMLCLLVASSTGCSTTPRSSDDRISLDADSAAAVARFKANDPGLKGWFNESYAYAIFPTVGKGGAGIGGAYGRGQVYERGRLVGYSTLTHATFGFQFGAQTFSEVIFFKDRDALRRFQSGSFELSAQVSAVIATAGASRDVDFSRGIAIFTATKGGLMYEATIGGQKFSYEPVSS